MKKLSLAALIAISNLAVAEEAVEQPPVPPEDAPLLLKVPLIGDVSPTAVIGIGAAVVAAGIAVSSGGGGGSSSTTGTTR